MKKITFVLVLFIIISCNEKNKSISKTNEMERNLINITIDQTLSHDTINKYFNYKDNELLKGDTIIKLYEIGDVYVKSYKLKNNNFIHRVIYNKNSLQLKRSGMSFIDMPIGIHKFYDSKGKVLNIKDYDKGFSFTVNNFISKVKTDLNIDLNRPIKGIEIGRSIKNNKAIYYFRIPVDTTQVGYNTYREVIINADNGHLINDKILTPTED